MTFSQQLSLDQITKHLSDYTPALLTPGARGHAAVAMVLREFGVSPEVLFIIRASHDQDPWSGNIGFPGGRLNRNGESARTAAEREANEELSLDLSQATCLGRLDDLYGATLPVLVSCFVYRIDQHETLQPNHEVAETFWYPLTELLNPARQQLREFSHRGENRTHPVVDILEPGKPFLWGITYRLIRHFFALCDIEFGEAEVPVD